MDKYTIYLSTAFTVADHNYTRIYGWKFDNKTAQFSYLREHQVKMNNITSNIQFLSICQYITNLRILFSANDLTIEHLNQYLPVFKASFQYLNESSNSTVAKIQLWQKSNFEKNDMKYVNETYQYIINGTLFSHNGHIGYLLGIVNKNNTIFSELRKIFSKGVSENYVHILCSSKNYGNLSRLGIEKRFEGYVWPTFIEGMRKDSHHLRSKRQMLDLDNDDDSDDDSIMAIYGSTIVGNSDESSSNSDDTAILVNVGSSNVVNNNESSSDTDDTSIFVNFGSSTVVNNNESSSDTERGAILDDDGDGTSILANVGNNNESSSDTDDTSIFVNVGSSTVGNNNESNSDTERGAKLNQDQGSSGTVEKPHFGSDDTSMNAVDNDNNVGTIDTNDFIDVGDKPQGGTQEIFIPSDIGELNSSDIAGNSKSDSPKHGESPDQISPLIPDVYQKYAPEYNAFVEMLKIFQNGGLLALKENKKIFKRFQIDSNLLALEQIDENWVKEPLKLFCSETTSRRHIVESLKRLGEPFFFNDITMLTKMEKGKLPWKLWRPVDLEDDSTYKIYYSITINSHYGFVNLVKMKDFENHYITFSDVMFDVSLTEIIHEGAKKSLVLHMTNSLLNKTEWKLNRDRELILLNAPDKEKSKRMESIEKAADFITSILPMHTFEMSVNKLKGYVLKLESGTTVPSYDDLARDLCDNLPIDSYNQWKVHNNKLIDDVLYETNFNVAKSYDNFRGILSVIFTVDSYNKYKNTSELTKMMRFEDFAIIEQYLPQSKHITKLKMARLAVSLYRLALRECDNEFIDNITLYSFDFVKEIRLLISNLQVDPNFKIPNFLPFSTDPIVEKRKLAGIMLPTEHPLYLEIDFENRCGIVNVNRFLQSETDKFVVSLGTKFPITYHNFTNIDYESVYFIQMEDKRSKESKMIDMSEKLYEILTEHPEMLRYYN